MDYSSYLKDQTLFICPNDVKTNILNYLNEHKMIVNVKFMDLGEFKKNWFFDYDLNAVNYLVKKYGYKPTIAKELIQNMYYVEDKEYGVEKLDILVRHKKELKEQGLLIFNKLFEGYISKWNKVVIGYGRLDKFTASFLDGEVVEYPYVEKEYEVYKFTQINDEVEFIYNKIADLLAQGVNINNIYVMNANEEYANYFKRYNTYYGFNVVLESSDSIVGTQLCQKLLELVDENGVETMFNYLKEYNSLVADKLKDVLNRFSDIDIKENKELFYGELLATSIPQDSYTDVVKCIPPMSFVDDQDHIILCGFNDAYPKYKFDTDYITDNVCALVNVNSCEEENIRIKENTINYLSSIKNLYISYSENTPFNTHNKSPLMDELKIKEVAYQKPFNYSEKKNMETLSFALDQYSKYGEQEDSLGLLYGNYGVGSYADYDNRFKGLSSEQANSIGKVTLAYTSMNTFYQCYYKYYLNNILKIDSSAKSLAISVGNIYHSVLEKAFDDGFDFEEVFNEEYAKISKNGITNKDAYFLNSLKDELKEDIEVLNEQRKQIGLTNEISEQKVSIEINDKLNFFGKIDKIFYDFVGGRALAAIVDYKTGSTNIEPSHFQFGLDAQLPAYMFLMKHFPNFEGKEVEFCGFYLQHILDTSITTDSNKSLYETKQTNMKLKGYTTSNKERLKYFDSEITDGQYSSFIRGLRIKKDGDWDSASNIISDEEVEEYIKMIDEKIIEAGNMIQAADFGILPAFIDGKNQACTYCPYGDICYRRSSDRRDFVVKGKQEDDEDAEMD